MKSDFYLVEVVEESGCFGELIGGFVGLILLLAGLAMDFAIIVLPETVGMDEMMCVIIMVIIWMPAIIVGIIGNMEMRDWAYIICACPIAIATWLYSLNNSYGFMETILNIVVALLSAWLPSGIARWMIRQRYEN